MDVRESFIVGIEPPETPTELAWWFAFVGDRLVLVSDAEGGDLAVLSASDSAALGLTTLAQHYLGRLGNVDCWAVDLGRAADTPIPAGMTTHQLRGIYTRIDDDLFALAGRAVQIVEWGRNHQFCGRCGTPTVRLPRERAMRCPDCGLITYPRLSPAVIIQVTRGERLLLARNANFPAAFFSVIAGFVEPGESLEMTVRRELREEVGIEVTDIRYFGSQPWPFPNSLMIGFTAKWASNELAVNLDELAEARWFGVDELPNIPPRLSIARRLIDDFIRQQGVDPNSIAAEQAERTREASQRAG